MLASLLSRPKYAVRETRVVERIERVQLRGPRDVWQYAVSKGVDHLNVEEFRVLLLDAQHRLVEDVLVSVGTLNSTLVHPREVFRPAIANREGCASIILMHNHPSGDPSPSADDRNVTASLVAGGRLLDIPVHDHIIVGYGKFLSFAEAGLL